MIATLLVALAIAGGTGAPAPDPTPQAGPGPIAWWSYSYPTVSNDGRYRMRCFVPAHGKRYCVVTGVRR